LSDEPDLAREQIEQILLVSRRNNEAAEITGALLFSDTNFSQVLEGPRAEVERLYETLNQDPCHKDLLLLLSAWLRGSSQIGRWRILSLTNGQNRRRDRLAVNLLGLDGSLP
jgi:Sensors of blue-light using FAD